jgi:hypothetical protein
MMSATTPALALFLSLCAIALIALVGVFTDSQRQRRLYDRYRREIEGE